MCDWGKAKVPGFHFGLVSLEGLHTLVVADAPDALEQLRVELGIIRGAQVTTTSAAMLPALFRQVQPDVVIFDIETIDVNLSVLLQPVQASQVKPGRQISIIALADRENRNRAFAQGFRVVLTKPVEPTELAAAIASFTGRLG